MCYSTLLVVSLMSSSDSSPEPPPPGARELRFMRDDDEPPDRPMPPPCRLTLVARSLFVLLTPPLAKGFVVRKRRPELVAQVVALSRERLVRLQHVLELALRLALADLLALHLLLYFV